MTRSLQCFLISLLLVVPTSQGFGVPKGKFRPTLKRTSEASISVASLELPLPTATSPLDTAPGSIVGADSSIATPKVSPIISLVKTYQTTIISTLIVTLGALVTHNLNLSVQALQLRRNMLAGSIIFSLGDVGAQLLTLPPAARVGQTPLRLLELDQQRLAISTVLGAVYGGICNPAVYALAETVLPGTGSVRRILLKMALSCSILSTAGNYVTMFFRRYVAQILLEVLGGDPQKKVSFGATCRRLYVQFQATRQSCNRDMPHVLKDDLKVWPLYDILVFSVIPPPIRPIANACMSSLWSMYMSMVSAKQQESNVAGAGSDVETEDSQTMHAGFDDSVTKAAVPAPP